MLNARKISRTRFCTGGFQTRPYHPSPRRPAVVLRKIQIRELAVQFIRLAVPGLRRLDRIVEPPKIIVLSRAT